MIIFTDSMNILVWLQTAPDLLEKFILNRVCKIIYMTPNSLWQHVAGNQNPADCDSRGLNPSQVLDHPLWWHGPRFLTQCESSWPISNYEPQIHEIKHKVRQNLASFKVPNYSTCMIGGLITLN